jgi:hypothetical protein
MYIHLSFAIPSSVQDTEFECYNAIVKDKQTTKTWPLLATLDGVNLIALSTRFVMTGKSGDGGNFQVYADADNAAVNLQQTTNTTI